MTVINKVKELLVLSGQRFWPGFLFSLIVFAFVIGYHMWPVLYAPSHVYPWTVDGIGHLTKVKYFAECLKDLKWPSWFPYWYSGSTTFQYYPPLSFIQAIPLQILSDSTMFTFKAFTFLNIWLAAMGCWWFCRQFGGNWLGIISGLLYVLQPYNWSTNFYIGATAQTSIIALIPWAFGFAFLLMQKSGYRYYILSTLSTSLLILSHAMQAFLVVISISFFYVALVFFMDKNKWLNGMIKWFLSVIVGCGLVAMWWLPGVTSLETAGLPYFLSERAYLFSSDISWFNPLLRNISIELLYFPLSIVFLSMLSFVTLLVFRKIQYKNYYIPLFFSFTATLILSTKQITYLSSYIPFVSNLVLGRFLTISSFTGSILTAVVILWLLSRGKKKTLTHLMSIFTAIFLLFLIYIDFKPYFQLSRTSNYNEMRNILGCINDVSNDYFSTGRFMIKNAYYSGEAAFFPYLFNINMSDGWNVEGSPHQKRLVYHNIAHKEQFPGMIVADFLKWNVRSVLISADDLLLKQELERTGFFKAYSSDRDMLMHNNSPPAYFMREDKDAIVLGKASLGMVEIFPWLAWGHSPVLEEYPLDMLAHFRLIYIIEPEVKDFRKFQDTLSKLAAGGKMVIVEMGRAETWPLLNTIPYWGKILSGTSLVPVLGNLYDRRITLVPDPRGQAPVIENLDGVLMEFERGGIRGPAIGYKSVGSGRVYFVGLAMGQQLQTIAGGDIKQVLERLMDEARPNKSIMPSPFPVADAMWGHDGFSFRYSLDRPEPVWISVTYTPRWRAFVDGKPMPVYNQENLVLVDLPSGSHLVVFKYGMTWVGWAGIGFSIASLVVAIIISLKINRIEEILSGFRVKRVFEKIAE